MIYINYIDRNQGAANYYVVVFSDQGAAYNFGSGLLESFSPPEDPNSLYFKFLTEGRAGLYSAEINTIADNTYNYEVWAAADILNPSRSVDKLLGSGSFIARDNEEFVAGSVASGEVNIKGLSALVDLQRAVRDIRSRIRR